ncbi:hypothetical protein AYI69_g4008 [Smittium culicis]|uniref:Uncharacterized protein n=1 Tax=Smittium culicis TaxID=133412 RepID=A0A1R1YHJ3_9FUNG|nr:hypothetical protein AYI69_g4008 [Smittium culicis]
MTTEIIAAHEKEQIQEVPTNSTVPIVLRKKGHTEKKTPPHIYQIFSGYQFTDPQIVHMNIAVQLPSMQLDSPGHTKIKVQGIESIDYNY